MPLKYIWYLSVLQHLKPEEMLYTVCRYKKKGHEKMIWRESYHCALVIVDTKNITLRNCYVFFNSKRNVSELFSLKSHIPSQEQKKRRRPWSHQGVHGTLQLHTYQIGYLVQAQIKCCRALKRRHSKPKFFLYRSILKGMTAPFLLIFILACFFNFLPIHFFFKE